MLQTRKVARVLVGLRLPKQNGGAVPGFENLTLLPWKHNRPHIPDGVIDGSCAEFGLSQPRHLVSQRQNTNNYDA